MIRLLPVHTHCVDKCCLLIFLLIIPKSRAYALKECPFTEKKCSIFVEPPEAATAIHSGQLYGFDFSLYIHQRMYTALLQSEVHAALSGDVVQSFLLEAS